MPERIQRKRTKGWRAPLCGCGCGKPARYVGRPSKYGNPYGVSGETTALIATRLFRDMLNRAPTGDTGTGWGHPGETVFDTIRRELGGHDLTCWCPLQSPCHADELLRIANDSTTPPPEGAQP